MVAVSAGAPSQRAETKLSSIAGDGAVVNAEIDGKEIDVSSIAHLQLDLGKWRVDLRVEAVISCLLILCQPLLRAHVIRVQLDVARIQSLLNLCSFVHNCLALRQKLLNLN